jgi:U3 small nucleolar ribonucleoprotein protein LCP5
MEAEPTVHSSLELLGQISSTSGHLNTQLDELLDGESTDAIVEDGRTTTSCGISLLDLKNHLLTSYLHNLTNLLIVRISQTNGIPLQTPEKAAGLSSSQIVQQLVWLRLVFERVRPLESKLKYQIDKLLKTVQELDQHSFSNPSAEIDHMMNGKSFFSLIK